MEKLCRYRWYHKPSGKTGTRDRLFVSEKAFQSCLDYWNTWEDWKYLPVEDADPDDHIVEKDSVYAGPFQFYGI